MREFIVNLLEGAKLILYLGPASSRYTGLNRKEELYRAMEILEHLDDDCSGGVSFEEFELFSDT